jgi:hypothetical protein
MMSLSKFKAFLVMSVIFLLGAVAGASLGTAIVSKKFAAASANAPLAPAKIKLIDKFRTRLNLSPTQTERLQLILEDTKQQFRGLHETVKPQFEEIRQRMRSQIREQLNDQQRQEFEVMVREYDERRAREDQK